MLDVPAQAPPTSPWSEIRSFDVACSPLQVNGAPLTFIGDLVVKKGQRGNLFVLTEHAKPPRKDSEAFHAEVWRPTGSETKRIGFGWTEHAPPEKINSIAFLSVTFIISATIADLPEQDGAIEVRAVDRHQSKSTVDALLATAPCKIKMRTVI